MSRRMLIVAMVPAALLAAARVVFLVLSVWDIHPFWIWQPLNLAEAAALRDRGEVSRLLAAGEDPNRTYRVRRGFLANHAMDVTPLRAAQSARRNEIVLILLEGGAVLDPPAPQATP